MKQRILTVAQPGGRLGRLLVQLGMIAILAVTGLAGAQILETPKANEQGTTVAEAPKETLSVTILDAESGRPVPRAKVIFPFANDIRYPGPVPIQTADESGRVTLPRILDAQTGFGVLHPEYAPVAVIWNWASPLESTKRPEVPREYTVRLNRGVEIGGTVIDEDGKPVPNVRVEIKASTLPNPDTDTVTAVEYPFYQTALSTVPVTDEQGRWSCAHFPKDIELLKIDCMRPDHSRVQFHTEKLPWSSSLGGSPIKKADVFAKNVRLTLTEGITVQGVVVDPAGKPLAGITLKETDGRQPAVPLAEIVTGADGRFELTNRDPHQILITATGTGYATNPTVVNVEQGIPEVRIQMVPSIPLRVRVVDEGGKPLAKVQMTPELKFGWTGISDEEGRILLNESPAEPLAYHFQADGHGAVTKRLVPTQAEQVIQIRKGETPSIPVTVRAFSEENEPLTSFTVSVLSGKRENDTTGVAFGDGKDGIYTGAVPLEKTGSGNFRLRIDAPGFDRFLTEKLSVERDVEVTARMQKSAPVEGIVLLHNGRPAVGAVLLIPEAGKPSPTISFQFVVTGLRFAMPNRPPISVNERVRIVRVDSDGRYTLPSTSEDHAVVVVHADGFAEKMLSQLKEEPEVRLQPWGQMEGTYLLNSKPRENVRLMVRPKERSNYTLRVYERAETDIYGKFRFEILPPGEYILYHSAPSPGTAQTHPLFVDVEPGRITSITYACTGRTITGRVRLDVPYVMIDWTDDIISQTLTRKRSGEDESPAPEDYVRSSDYQKAYEQWNEDHRNDGFDTFGVEFESDGSFRAEGIPEGTYEMEFSLAKRKSAVGGWGNSIGTLKCEIVVPMGRNDEPLDVGVLKVPVQDRSTSRKPNAILSAKTFDGAPLDLAQYRGKFVLLTFWAPWAKPSAEELVQWKAVSKTFGTHSRVAMIGVALADKPGITPKAPEITGLKWIHAQLEGRDKATFTEAWSVDSLPVTYLVSPDGWIIARDIKPERVRSMVEEALRDAK